MDKCDYNQSTKPVPPTGLKHYRDGFITVWFFVFVYLGLSGLLAGIKLKMIDYLFDRTKVGEQACFLVASALIFILWFDGTHA